MVQEVLTEAGVGVRDLGGIAVLRGPGSFTGLRIGLATVLGLHQALGVPATAIPSLPVLAASAGVGEGDRDRRRRRPARRLERPGVHRPDGPSARWRSFPVPSCRGWPQGATR